MRLAALPTSGERYDSRLEVEPAILNFDVVKTTIV